jgi:peptidoglycan hydrolase-like protein with peptidoglycan-binding domain
MKIKLLTILIINTLLFNTAFALTQEDIDLLVAAGFIPQDKVAAANSVVKSSNTSTTKTQTTQTPFVYGSKSSSSSSCLKISTDLFVGATGSVVTSLQNFLKSKGHFAESSTGYYGSLTQAAVEKFQKAEGIVLNGTPETTGLGKVGPATRSAIEKISCAGSSATSTANSFFGYNLDDLFKPVSIDYDIEFDTDIAFDTNLNFEDYEVGEFDEIDFEDFDFDFEEIEFDNNVSGYDISSKDGVGTYLFAKAVNGEYLRSGNNKVVAVKSMTDVELAWESDNVRNCVLTGDFKEKQLSVPNNGTAKLSFARSTGGTASNGDPIYQFSIGCSASTTRAYALPVRDNLKLWVYNASSTSAQ